MKATLSTSLPAGTYRDLLGGVPITVESDGSIDVTLASTSAVAISPKVSP
jgi:hypothetical protein